MNQKVVYRGDDGRLQVESPLMRESLINEALRQSTGSEHEAGLLPNLNIISLGGQSIIDRGRRALLPLIDELVRCRSRHKLILGVGGGARVRHTLHIALSLGIPTGGLAALVATVDVQNQRMMAAMLAKHKGVLIDCCRSPWMRSAGNFLARLRDGIRDCSSDPFPSAFLSRFLHPIGVLRYAPGP